MATRKRNTRSTNRSLQKRTEEWSKEAHGWVYTRLQDLATEESERTVADFMVLLDNDADQPPGYIRLLSGKEYPARYNMVRVEAERLAKQGRFEVATTVNALGREGVVCYRKASPRKLKLMVGAGATDADRKALDAWMTQHGHVLRRIAPVLIDIDWGPDGVPEETKKTNAA